MKTKIMRCTVDIYVIVERDTTAVAVEGIVAEGIDHGVMFMLMNISLKSKLSYLIQRAQRVGEHAVPKGILDTWDEAEDMLLEPKKP